MPERGRLYDAHLYSGSVSFRFGKNNFVAVGVGGFVVVAVTFSFVRVPGTFRFVVVSIVVVPFVVMSIVVVRFGLDRKSTRLNSSH